MKKLLAILVALLMLATTVAFAEESFTFADPVLTLNMGETQTIDLTGFEIEVISGQVDDAVALQINFKGDGEKLMTINGSVVGSRFLFAFEGMDRTFYVDGPEQVANIQSLDLSGLDIDFEALVNNVLNSIEVEGDTMKIPYTAVNDILEAIAPALDGVELPGLDGKKVSDIIAQLKESDSGISLKGTFTQTDESNFSIVAEVIPVQNGEEGATAFNLGFDMGEAGVQVQIEVPGQFSGYCVMTPIDDTKVQVSIGGEAEGMGGDLTGIAYSGESDAELVLLDAASAEDFQAIAEADETLGMEILGAAGDLVQYFMSNESIMGIVGSMMGSAS